MEVERVVNFKTQVFHNMPDIRSVYHTRKFLTGIPVSNKWPFSKIFSTYICPSPCLKDKLDFSVIIKDDDKKSEHLIEEVKFKYIPQGKVQKSVRLGKIIR